MDEEPCVGIDLDAKTHRRRLRKEQCCIQSKPRINELLPPLVLVVSVDLEAALFLRAEHRGTCARDEHERTDALPPPEHRTTANRGVLELAGARVSRDLVLGLPPPESSQLPAR